MFKGRFAETTRMHVRECKVGKLEEQKPDHIKE